MIEYIRDQVEHKKVVAVGNPPYQESDGGFGKSAQSIYPFFTTILMESADISEFALVIPARWFGAGKNLGDFRDSIRTSGKVKQIRYFKKSNEIFPTVDINGGICFLHYAKNHRGSSKFRDGTNEENIVLDQYDIIVDDPLGYKLVEKVLNKWGRGYISEIAWTRKPYGLRTDYFNKNKELNTKNKKAIPCLTRNKSIKYANRDDISKNRETINLWKVCVPAAAGGSKGNRRSTVPINQIFLVDPGVILTETYTVIDVFSDKKQAQNLVDYLKTDFSRYFLGLRKITQHLPRDRWKWVPYIDASKEWTDQHLFKYFRFSESEIKHIQDKVKEWSC